MSTTVKATSDAVRAALARIENRGMEPLSGETRKSLAAARRAPTREALALLGANAWEDGYNEALVDAAELVAVFSPGLAGVLRGLGATRSAIEDAIPTLHLPRGARS